MKLYYKQRCYKFNHDGERLELIGSIKCTPDDCKALRDDECTCIKHKDKKHELD